MADAGVDASGKPESDGSSQRAGAPHPNPCLAGEVLIPNEADGWCYTKCGQESTCAGGFVCATIYAYYGSLMPVGYSVCQGPIGAPVGGACRSSNDCEDGASCVISTDCGDASVCSVCQN